MHDPPLFLHNLRSRLSHTWVILGYQEISVEGSVLWRFKCWLFQVTALQCDADYRWRAAPLPAGSVPALSPPQSSSSTCSSLPTLDACSLLLHEDLCSCWNIHPSVSPRLMALTASDLCPMAPALDTLSHASVLLECKFYEERDICLFRSLNRAVPGSC